MCYFSDNKPNFAYQVRTINKGWLSDLEILEIQEKINNEEGSNTISDTSNIKPKRPKRNERPTSENGNSIQPKEPKQALTQNQK